MKKNKLELSSLELQQIVTGLSATIDRQKKLLKDANVPEFIKAGSKLVINDNVDLINRLRPLYMEQWQLDKFPIEKV